MAILRMHYNPGQDGWKAENYMIPIPVKTVMRDYQIRDGFVIVDLPYDECGVITPEEDDEY